MASAAALSLSACVTPAPGSENVWLTRSTSDVTGCTAVGNVRVPTGENAPSGFGSDEASFRNQVIGLGGNTGFITSGAGTSAGVAYRCPPRK